ncbi:Smr domain-containing protein [Caballeronia temeraria]|uniref:Smr domain-containing protein n=1 Tax=Caballeronia temeraria TaxID=1777137 RepID=A0A157Z444_9BURK|nr:Smr/MutS family protein [Caballeronia temeraria]SAK40163.1 Smr domain-containing protein [Caballeronia temeraria]
MPKNLPHPNEPKVRRTEAPRPAAPAQGKPVDARDVAAAVKREGLSGLSSLKSALKADAEKREVQRVAAARAEREAVADADEFRRAIGDIEPLKTPPRTTMTRVPPAPEPLQSRRDEEAVLQEALSDEYDPESLLDIDETLSFCRPGISQEVVRKLRRGAWVVQAQLDLHGMRREEAREALAEFIRESVKRGLRCLRVIHGKGLGSIGKEPVLKGKVRAWLVQKSEVIAFCQARPHDGGAGAVLVLLQPGGVPRHHNHPQDEPQDRSLGKNHDPRPDSAS